MRNKHAGTCYRCGKTVEAGTGHFERRKGGWRVHHALHPGRGRVTCDMAFEHFLSNALDECGPTPDDVLDGLNQ